MTDSNERLQRGAIILLVAVVLFTGLDYLVNCVLYKFGLQFSMDWFFWYSLGYFSLYLLVTVFLVFYTRDWKLPLLCFVLVGSGTVDLVYFGLWGGLNFPADTWVWSGYYLYLGLDWTTSLQIIWSAITLCATGIGIFVGSKLET